MRSLHTVAIIPARNEADHIRDVVTEAKRWVDRVVVVDDHSSDNTGVLASESGAAQVSLGGTKGGKGLAITAGLLRADNLLVFDRGGIVVLLDGDGQHPAHLIPRFLETFRLSGYYAAVFGRRVYYGPTPRFRRVGNWVLNRLLKLLFGLRLDDAWCGMRALDLRRMSFDLKSRDYRVDVEIALAVHRSGLPYLQVDIPAIYHDPKKGAGIGDGLKLLLQILWWRIRPPSLADGAV